MNPSAIENAKRALEVDFARLQASHGLWGWWLELFIALVVSVVVEFFVVVKEHRHSLHEYRRGTIRSPEKPGSGISCGNLGGAGLVAIGVSGELFVDFKVGSIEAELREASKKLVALLNLEAAIARNEASAARKEVETRRSGVRTSRVRQTGDDRG